MIAKNKNPFYKINITLKTSDKNALQKLKKELFLVFDKNSSLEGFFDIVNEHVEKKYITIAKSPFVYKKSKDSFLFNTYSSSIECATKNFILVNFLTAKLENFKGIVESSIEARKIKVENKQFSVEIFGEEFLTNNVKL